MTACQPEQLDELVASGLLVGDGSWLRFRHEIARLAVEQGVAAYRRGLSMPASSRPCSPASTDDARLAYHAEAAGDQAAVLRFAPAAAQRAAELASHREAAAQFERALRFADGAEPALAAALSDGLASELALVDRWDDAAAAGERALALWRAAGDRLREGDTLRQLSRTMWRLCRGRESAEAAEAALAVLKPLGPSVELATAYANMAAQRMKDGDNEAAIDLARQAAAIAEPLGASAVLSDALNTEACAIGGQGLDGTDTLRRALEIALRGQHEEQAGRAYANLLSLYCMERRFAEAEPVYADGIAYCDEHDITTFASCLRGERAALEETGQWDEAALLAAALVARHGASPINRLNPLISLGKIRARRGEPAAWGCLDEAMAAAAGSAEPALVAVARLARAEANWLRGELGAARHDAELAADVAAGCDAWDRGAIGVWLRRTGSRRRLQDSLPRPMRRLSWATGARQRGCGPTWVARTKPPWRWAMRTTTRRCGRPCGPSMSWVPPRRLA